MGHKRRSTRSFVRKMRDKSIIFADDFRRGRKSPSFFIPQPCPDGMGRTYCIAYRYYGYPGIDRADRERAYRQ